jgi:hypothetical protein
MSKEQIVENQTEVISDEQVKAAEAAVEQDVTTTIVAEPENPTIAQTIAKWRPVAKKIIVGTALVATGLFVVSLLAGGKSKSEEDEDVIDAEFE